MKCTAGMSNSFPDLKASMILIPRASNSVNIIQLVTFRKIMRASINRKMISSRKLKSADIFLAIERIFTVCFFSASILSVPYYIAYASYCLYHLDAVNVIYLASDVSDVDVNYVGLAHVVKPPHVFKKSFA